MPDRELKEVCLSRIPEVAAGLEQIPDSRDRPAGQTRFQELCAAGISIAHAVYGQNSLQMRELLAKAGKLREKNENPGVMDKRIAIVLQGFLQNLASEVEAGLVSDVFTRGIGTAIADFVTLADEAIEAGQKDVAAVLASAALKDALKQKAELLGEDVAGKSLAETINALKANSFFQRPEAKIVASYVTLRNHAMHADWSRISGPDVASLVGFLKTFVVRHF